MGYKQAETGRRAAADLAAATGLAQDAVLSWYAAHRRDLPWRRPEASPWAVLVSEIMLQQTPVARVLPAYQAWLERWPTPAALAAAPAGEAVRQWGRLGYPRRALRLHAAACILALRHGGEVPASHADLLGLPGIGRYTAHYVRQGDDIAVSRSLFVNRDVVEAGDYPTLERLLYAALVDARAVLVLGHAE